jgi:hypothetical protein
LKTSSTRIQLTKKQTFFHYFFVLALPLSLFLITELLLHFFHLNAEYRKFLLIFISLVNLSFVLYFSIRQYKSLRYHNFKTHLSQNDFKLLMAALSNKYNWIIEEDGKDYCIFTVPFKWYHWGTLMTVVHSENQIQFNSICDLYNRPATSSFGLNKKNLQKFALELNSFKNLKISESN